MAMQPVPSTAAQKVLLQPELLGMIFPYLRDYKHGEHWLGLAVAARVCSVWFHVAVPILWKKPLKMIAWPSLRHLNDIASKDLARFQFYLGQIHYFFAHPIPIRDKSADEVILETDSWENARYEYLYLDLSSDSGSASFYNALLHKNLIMLKIGGPDQRFRRDPQSIDITLLLDTIMVRC